MRMINTLIKKDIYEYKNNIKKTLFTLLVALAVPLMCFNYMGVSSAYFIDRNLFVELLAIVFSLLVYCETTLFQVHRDIRDGVYEKYYINNNLKKYEILISKCILNFILIFVVIIILYILNSILGIFSKNHFHFYITNHMIISLSFSSVIGTCLAFINSLIITDEKNAATYGISLCIVYLGYYKMLEMMSITSILIEVIGLFALCMVFVTITMVLLKKNRFMKRG